MAKFTINEMKDMQHDAASWGGIPFTLSQVETILEGKNEMCKKLSKRLREDYDHNDFPTDGAGMDTMGRDIWFDLIAQHFTDQYWPLYGDGPTEGKVFQAQLEIALRKAGIRK